MAVEKHLYFLLVVVVGTATSATEDPDSTQLLQITEGTKDYAISLRKPSDSCPLWFRRNLTTGQCECGDDLKGIVHCDRESKQISVLFCYCMTYNSEMDVTMVGPCLQLCTRKNTPKCQSFNQISTRDKKLVNHEMCSKLQREGQLCGECSEGHGLPVYSYTLYCVNCTSNNFVRKLFKYIVMAYLPLTGFYAYIIIFRLSGTVGNMVAYILTCQILTSPPLLMAMTHDDQNHFILSWFSVWNLDFVRLTYPAFCLHPRMSILQVQVLDYLVGLYPLFLIFLTYIAATLHDRYPLVVKIWKPLYKLFAFLRKKWDIRGSLVETLATFLVLSYIKTLNISLSLLAPAMLKTNQGKPPNRTYLFINGELLYFGKEHLPYGVLAIIMFTVFNILPAILLLLYPCRCFCMCLKKRCGRSGHFLCNLMVAFQGCYRQPPDAERRYFAGLYLLVRIVFVLTLLLVQDPLCFAIFGFYFLVLALIVILAEPYKEKKHNIVDTFFFLAYAALSFVGGLYVYLSPSEPFIKVTPILISVVTPVSLIVIFYSIVVIVVPKKMADFVKKWCKKVLNKAEAEGTSQIDDLIPYRLET